MTLEDNLTLTPNAISELIKPTFDHVTKITPICQVLTVEKLRMKTGPNRYKIILSDGTHCVEAVLAHKANWIATKLDSNDIVQIVGYNTVTTNTYNVIIIQDLVIKQLRELLWEIDGIFHLENVVFDLDAGVWF